VIGKEEAKRLLRVLSRHSDIIIDAYLKANSEIIETEDTSRAIDDLVAQRLAYRPGGDEEARLSMVLSRLFDHALLSAKRQHIDADIGGQIRSIEDLVNNYKVAKKSGNFEDAETLIHHIEEMVHHLAETLANNTRQLWRQIDSEFGHVSSLEMKVLENQRVLQQAKRLNDGLEMITFNELNEQAGEDRHLRHLLVKVLPAAMGRCQNELADAMHRLRDMLFEFRRLQDRARLVYAFYTRYQKEPGYQPNNYGESIDVSPLISQVMPLDLRGHADTDNDAHELALTQMLVGIRKTDVPDEALQTDRLELDEWVEEEPVEFPVSAVKQCANDFYEKVIDTGALSGMSCYTMAADHCSPNMWLHAIISRYLTLPSEDKALFTLNYKGESDSVFDGRLLVDDVEVSCRI